MSLTKVTYSMIENGVTTRNLYVAPTGSNTANTGVSVSSPFATVQYALDYIVQTSTAENVAWTVNLAAGTYTENVQSKSLQLLTFPVTIRGPSVGGGAPTAIISAADSATNVVEIQGGGNVYFILQDVTLTGATTAWGFNTGGGASCLLLNVHISNCRYGVLYQHGAFIRIDADCRFTGNGTADGGWGITGYYNATHDMKGRDVGDGAIIKDYDIGVFLNEGVQGHVDFIRIEDCNTGLKCIRGVGAINTKQMQIYRCGVGLNLWGSPWFNNGIDFGTGADACTVNAQPYGSSPEVDYLAQDNPAKTFRAVESINPIAHTGTTSQTTIHQANFRAWMISEGKHFVKFTVFGNCTLSADCDIFVYASDGVTPDFLCGVTIPAGTLFFKIDIDVNISNFNSQRGSIAAVFDGNKTACDQGNGLLDMKNKIGSFRWEAQLGNAADVLTVACSRFETTLGG
jgi:hypothetical protein